MKKYNIGKSWFGCQEQAWNSECSEESASRRKIVIPEEDIDYDNNEYYSDSDDENIDANDVLKKVIHHLIMDIALLEKGINEMLSCKSCNSSISILENKNCREGLGTKLVNKV